VPDQRDYARFKAGLPGSGDGILRGAALGQKASFQAAGEVEWAKYPPQPITKGELYSK
jgi:hypothetical protein